MKTFIELYEFLQVYDKKNIIEWLNENWKGKDKQESLLRLLGMLGMIDKLNSYEFYNGNFNTINMYINNL